MATSPRADSLEQRRAGKIPLVYFGWTEANPVVYLLRFLAFGEGDTAPVTREALRQVEALCGGRQCTSDSA